jgi:hypothetical protein
MSVDHAAIYIAILFILAMPAALAFVLTRWLVRRSRA